MTDEVLSVSVGSARRLAVTKQHLAGSLPARPTKDAILSVVRDLFYVQWDPVSIVAPSHVIALWSRVGDFRLSDLDQLLWKERRLLQHSAPFASIVLTEDYPLLSSLMQRYPDSLSSSWGAQRARARKFLAEHGPLRKSILRELRREPKRLSEFEAYVRTGKSADGWTSGNEVSTMLAYLQMKGDVMIVGHAGNQNVWGLPDQFLPSWVKREPMDAEEFEREAAQRAIRALGTASPREIHLYFPRGMYLNLKKVLEGLQGESKIHRVNVSGVGGRNERYVHDRDVRLLESMESNAWQPRMSLLAAFDNLLVVMKRVFGFAYVHEQFLPKEKRKYGTYVLPILWGDRFIGRIDPQMDKGSEKLVINSVHAERGAPGDQEVARQVAETIERFAAFLGAREVAYSSRVPPAWRSALR